METGTKRLWIDGQEGEDGYEGLEKVLKKRKISLPMSRFCRRKMFAGVDGFSCSY